MALFLVPDRCAEAIVGLRLESRPPPPESVTRQLARKALLDEKEVVRAAIDESCLDDGSHGLVLTNGRFFRYSGRAIRAEVRFGDVVRARVRRVWSPAAALGRGEIGGGGQVVLLRFRFELADGHRREIALSAFAASAYPLVDGLLHELGAKLVVGRTLPGI
jgi:hypothetical protein